MGNPRYTGRICRLNSQHGGERFVSGGGCVRCAAEAAERRRRLRGTEVRGPLPQARHPMKSPRRAAARAERALTIPGKRGRGLGEPERRTPRHGRP